MSEHDNKSDGSVAELSLGDEVKDEVHEGDWSNEEPEITGFFRSDKWLFSLMLISATISLVASFVLSFDALVLAANPNQALACDISAVLSCGTVASSWQAQLLGFPNAFLGMMSEPVMITIAIAGLTGSRFRRGFMIAAQVIYAIGLTFALWLFTQSAFVIGAFCPWCLLVTLGTSITFFTLLRYNIKHRHLFPKGKLGRAARFAVRTSVDTLVEAALLAAIVLIIIVKYGPYLLP